MQSVHASVRYMPLALQLHQVADFHCYLSVLRLQFYNHPDFNQILHTSSMGARLRCLCLLLLMVYLFSVIH